MLSFSVANVYSLMNKSRAHVELYKLYTGPAFIHLVCIKLYIYIYKTETDTNWVYLSLYLCVSVGNVN